MEDCFYYISALDLTDFVPQHKHVLFKDRLCKRIPVADGKDEDKEIVDDKTEKSDPEAKVAKSGKGEPARPGESPQYEFHLRTSPTNRCLMCENCAKEGMDCKINLTQGIRSWYA